MKTLKLVNSLAKKHAPPGTIVAMNKLLKTDDSPLFMAGAIEITTIFGDSNTFKSIAEKKGGKDEKKLISSFQKNTQLLVQKTWIEKSDGALKDQVFYQLETICTSLLNEEYCESYQEFMTCLETIVYLMFGAQTKKPDFAEYAIRIDPDFGTFWWFLQNAIQKAHKNEEICRIYQLIAMIFLANY
ncbi:MAG TPA: hypothetical protein VFC68_06965 [Treponemataceae bacterium]|nr:hypothetical protein [Treponemataceae bacterium]